MKTATCGACGGSGAMEGEECPFCDGKGELR